MTDHAQHTTQVDDRKLERTRNRLEINNTLILAIATLAITWCSYQSTLWSGIQDFKLAESNKLNRLAQEKTIVSGQHVAMDEAVVIGFVDAVIEKRSDKIDYLLDRVRPELSAIMSLWLAKHPLESKAAPPHPMVMQEYRDLVKKEMAVTEQLTRKADETWDAAEKANTNADNYTLFTVIFSMVMFLGAIATKMSHVRLSFTLILIAGIICIGILAILFFSMPLARE